MFWHKRITHKFPLVVFGLVALGIIVSSTILIVKLFQERDVYETKRMAVVSGENTSLEGSYFSSMNSLLNSVEQKSTVNDLINSTKEVFLSVRVPAKLRDSHLSAFLEVVKLEDKKETLTLDQLKIEIKNILQNIITLENK